MVGPENKDRCGLCNEGISVLHVVQKSYKSYFEDDTDNDFCYFENDTENVCKQDLMYLDNFSIWCIKYHKSQLWVVIAAIMIKKQSADIIFCAPDMRTFITVTLNKTFAYNGYIR